MKRDCTALTLTIVGLPSVRDYAALDGILLNRIPGHLMSQAGRKMGL
jgi:hypothetical protein